MLDNEANLLLFFTEREQETMVRKLEKLGFSNFFYVSKSEVDELFVQKHKIDYIFASVLSLSDMSFVDSVRRFNSATTGVPIIFCLHNFDEASLNLIADLPLSDFIKYDFCKEDLIKSFFILRTKVAGFRATSLRRKFFFIKKKKLITKLPVSEILYIKVDSKYLELHTSKEIHLVRSTLNSIGKYLPDNFSKVHQSYIVNIEHLDMIDTEANEMYVKGRKIPTSRELKKELLKRLYMP